MDFGETFTQRRIVRVPTSKRSNEEKVPISERVSQKDR